MKKFVTALDKDEPSFAYIGRKMPGLSTEKLKAGIFDGFHIRQLIKNPFIDFMSETEQNMWTSFVLAVRNFLGNHKTKNYVELVNMLNNFRDLGCNMNIKVPY